MSQANIELTRECLEAVNAADVSAVSRLVTPEVEMQDYPGLPDAQWHWGYEGVVAWTTKLTQVIGRFRLEGSNFLGSGEEVVFDWLARGHGRRVGVPIELAGSAVSRCQSGRVARMEVFTTRKEALEAVGLSE